MRKKTSTWLACLALTACAATTPHGPTVALAVQAPEADRAALDQQLRDAEEHLPVVMERREVPDRPSTPSAPGHDFAATRAAYDDGDLEGCLATLPDDARVSAALERGDAIEASRTLYWRMACLRALGRTDEAEAVAREHASRELPFPPDLGAANATAETMLRDAHRDVSAQPMVRVHVTSDPPGAFVSIDGRPSGESTPADAEVAPGAHLITLRLPTYATRSIAVVATADTPSLTATLSPLEPDAAASALHDALEAGVALDADLSLALLATALRARSLVLVSRDSDRSRAALFGAADEEEAPSIVRAERVGEHASDVEGLLRDVLVRGRLAAPAPPFYELPELWILVATAVAIGVGITLGLTLQPDVHTRVVFP